MTCGDRSWITDLTTPDELVVEAVVGEEGHRVEAAAHRRRTLLASLPAASDPGDGAGANPPMAPAPSALPGRSPARLNAHDSRARSALRKVSRPKISDVIHTTSYVRPWSGQRPRAHWSPPIGSAPNAQLGAAGRGGGDGLGERRSHGARSSTCRPAAVVPPGDVTIARSAAGITAIGEERRGTDEELRRHAGRRGRGGRPASDARVDERLGDEEHVGGARSGRARSRRRGGCSPTRSTVPTAPSTSAAQSRSSAVAVAPPAIADAPWPTSAGVFGMARTTATRRRRRRRLQRGERHAGGDRQDPPSRRRRPLAATAPDVAGLDGDHGGGARRDIHGDRDARELAAARPRLAASASLTASAAGSHPGREQAAEQRGAHVAAADDHQSWSIPSF